MDAADVTQDVLPMYKSVSTDEQDYVRLVTIEICIALCSKLTQEDISKNIIPVIITLSKDSAWKVRYNTANHFVEVTRIFFAIFFLLLNST